jgi:hypothetical protein
VPEEDTQLTRAIILALWPELRHGKWGPTVTRRLTDYGNRPAGGPITAGTVPNPAARDATETTRVRLALIATTPTTPALTVMLTEHAYQRALDQLTLEEHLAHQHSLTGSRPAPYRWSTSRGEAYLRETEHGWDWTKHFEPNGRVVTTYSARHARAALAKIAHAATPLPQEEPA